MKHILSLSGTIAVLAMFVACGGDSSNGGSENTSKIDEVERYEDLVHCTKSHYGELARVLENDSIYECTSDGWIPADSSALELLGSSESKEKSSSSTMLKPDSSDVAEVAIEKVESVTLTGFAQKGIFSEGSVVTVYGLDSAFKKTRTKFSGKVEGKKGEYSVKNITLDRQYALVEVQGFFFNEVSGKKTSGVKTKLNALVDLSSGKTVNANVNVLTELEYERVVSLVTKDHYNVAAAKKQAAKELLAIFGANKKSDLSTSLSLADTTSAGRALHVASVMLLGSQSLKTLANRLVDFSEDLAADGSWDDEVMKASIADDFSTNVDLETVRSNIIAMNVSSKVPNFEKIIYDFWVANFKLGNCSDSNETQISKNANKESSTYGKGFVCASGKWHLASDLDTEFGVCTSKMEGEYKASSSDSKYYTCKIGEWKEISKTAYELKSCTEEIENSSKQYVKTKSGEYFVCKDKQWVEINYPTFELKLCTESRSGEYALVSDMGPYVCNNETWSKVPELEYELQATNVCDKNRENKIIQAVTNGQYYLCENAQWVDATQLDYEIGTACTEKNQDSFKEFNGNVYYCREEWTLTTLDHMDLGACSDALVGSCAQAASGFFYECVDESFEWVKRDEIYCNIGVCTAGNEGEIGDVNGSKFLCANNQWEICDMTQKTHTQSSWLYYGNNKYAAYCLDRCDEMMCEPGMQIYEWQNASAAEMATGMRCVGAKAGTIKNGYTCVYDMDERGYAWRTASEGESWTGKICNSSNLYKVQSVTKNGSTKTFACDETKDGFEWRTASANEGKGGAVCNSSIVNQFNKAEGIVCRKNGSSYSWGSATTEEKATGYICTSTFNHSIVYSGYVCDSTKSTPAWRAATAYEKDVGYICRKSNVDSYYAAVGVSCVYENSTYKYRAATAGETANKKVCTSSMNHYQVSEGYVCDNTSGSYAWRSASNPEKAAGSVCYSDFNQKFAWVGSSPYRCTYSSGSYSFKSYSYDYVSHGGRTYKIIDIGDQVWTAENMGYSSSSITSYCYSGTTASTNCSGLGRLYSFAGALNKTEAECGKGVYCSSAGLQGVCPTGYHVPTNNDWTTLFSYIGASSSSSEYRNAGKYLKSTTGWNKGTDDNGLDLYGFSIKPNGYGQTDGSSYKSYGKDDYTYFWTSSYDKQKITAYTWRFVSYDRTSSYSQHDAIRYSHNVEHLAYVRCVKKK